MNITVAEQLRGFCFALGMGLFLGILYDGFRLLRLFWRPPRRQQFFLDVFCMLLMGLFTFMLALAVSSGQLRMYVLVGEGVGFSLYALTVGKVTEYAAKWVGKFLKRFIWPPIARCRAWIGRGLQKSRQKIEGVAKFFYKKRKRT